jgi:SynChlorMet cassette protein ScmC
VIDHPEIKDVVFEVKELSRYLDHIDENVPWSQFVLELSILRLIMYAIFKEAQNSGGVPLHSALAAWNGMGVLLVGDSGIGKSTCCNRLPPPWEALSDDETLVIRAGEQRYVCHPFPTWSNLLRNHGRKSWRVEENVPLSAVFILRQSQTDGLIPLPRERAAFLLAQAALQLWRVPRETFLNLTDNEEWPRRRQIFNNSYSIAAAVPAYILQVSLTGGFWERIEGVLTGLASEDTTAALGEAGST